MYEEEQVVACIYGGGGIIYREQGNDAEESQAGEGEHKRKISTKRLRKEKKRNVCDDSVRSRCGCVDKTQEKVVVE